MMNINYWWVVCYLSHYRSVFWVEVHHLTKKQCKLCKFYICKVSVHVIWNEDFCEIFIIITFVIKLVVLPSRLDNRFTINPCLWEWLSVEQDWESNSTKAKNISLFWLVAFFCVFDFRCSVVQSSSFLITKSIDIYRLTEIDKSKGIIIFDNDIIGFKVTVSFFVSLMKVCYCSYNLGTKVHLQFFRKPDFLFLRFDQKI